MIQIEVDLTKLERGTHVGRVKVTRGGKTFYRKQRVGVKEGERPTIPGSFDTIGPDEIDAFTEEWEKSGYGTPAIGYGEMQWGDRIFVWRNDEGEAKAYAHICPEENAESWEEFREWEETPSEITKEGSIKVVGVEWIESHSPGAGKVIIKQLLSKYDLVTAGMTTSPGMTLFSNLLEDHFGWTVDADLGEMYHVLGVKEQARQGITDWSEKRL